MLDVVEVGEWRADGRDRDMLQLMKTPSRLRGRTPHSARIRRTVERRVPVRRIDSIGSCSWMLTGCRHQMTRSRQKMPSTRFNNQRAFCFKSLLPQFNSALTKSSHCHKLLQKLCKLARIVKTCQKSLLR